MIIQDSFGINPCCINREVFVACFTKISNRITSFRFTDDRVGYVTGWASIFFFIYPIKSGFGILNQLKLLFTGATFDTVPSSNVSKMTVED